MRLLLAVLVLCGCGGADFSGTYSGTLTGSISCSDGSGSTQALATQWTISNSGDGLSVSLNGTCGTLTADVDTNTATLRQKTCQPSTANGVTSTVTITAGTLVLHDKSLSVSAFTMSNQMTGAIIATCTTPYSGTLTRQ